jgi:hypothetical protein
MNQTIAYETTRCTYADPNPTTAATTNVLNQIAFIFRVDEMINRRIISARVKRRVFGSVDHS